MPLTDLQGGRMIKRIAAVIAVVSLTTAAQQYYETSGQTRVFTLTAGSTAAAFESRSIPTGSPRLAVTMHKGVCLRLQGAAAGKISIYNVSGKRILDREIGREAPVAVSGLVPNGVYFARLEVSGRAVETVRFRVVR
jgi:hypothetical protein